MSQTIRIATRKSPLALKQATLIGQQLTNDDPSLKIELVEILSEGDRNTSIPLTNIGGKALFVKALQAALLNNEADIAVHCIKDMSVEDTNGLKLAAIGQREDVRDVFISQHHPNLTAMPEGSTIGTGSPRRQCLLAKHFPTLKSQPCRGNINSRIKKLTDNHFDGIILAAAGLKRLGLTNKITQYLEPDIFIPAIGQGCLGIECREDNIKLQARLQILHHHQSALCIHAERAVNRVLGGDCHSAIAAYARIADNQLILQASAGEVNSGTMINTTVSGNPEDAADIGYRAGHNLLAKGAQALLNK